MAGSNPLRRLILQQDQWKQERKSHDLQLEYMHVPKHTQLFYCLNLFKSIYQIVYQRKQEHEELSVHLSSSHKEAEKGLLPKVNLGTNLMIVNTFKINSAPVTSDPKSAY